MLRVSGAILLVVLLVGCQSRDILPKRTGNEFVPIQVGAYWEYDVTETTISPVNGQTNELTELRVDAIDVVSLNGQQTFILQRRTRPQGSSTWQPAETWSARVEEFQYVLQEGNVPYVRLQFPMVEGKTWNGNALNTLDGTEECTTDGSLTCDNYEATGLYEPFELPGVLLYDDTVTIVENDEDDPIIMKDLRKAVYAKDIGMVYREETHLEYCTIGPCIGQQVVENGTILRLTLTAYGHE